MSGEIERLLKLTADMQNLDSLNDTLTKQIALVSSEELAEEGLELVSAAGDQKSPFHPQE